MADKPHQSTRLFKNTIFGVLSWLTPFGIAIVATPLIVRNLGKSEYGIYATILGFISYSFTFGIGKVLAKFVAEFRASGESEKLSSSISAAVWFSLSVALTGTITVAIFAESIVSDVLAIPEEQRSVAVIAIYLACGTIIVTMISQLFQFILQGLHKFGSFLALTNLSGILLNIGNVVLALLGYGTDVLLTWNLACLGSMAALFGYYAIRHLPEFSISPSRIPLMGSPVFRYGSSIILYQIFGNVLFIFERAWILRKFGTEAATYYLVPMMLGIYLQGVVGSALQATFPVMNEMLTDRPRLIYLYKKATKLTVAGLGLAIVTLIVSGKLLLAVWIDADMAQQAYGLLIAHVLTFGLIAVIMNVWSLAEAFRAASMNAVVTFIWMAVSIPLMIITAERFGILGVGFSRLAGVIVTLPFVFIVERRFLGNVLWSFWVAIGIRLGVAVAAAAVAQVVLMGLLPSVNWISFFCVAAGGCVSFATVLLISGFLTSEERAMLQRFILRRT